MLISTNEGKACDAVVGLLERRTGLRRSRLHFPEKDHSGPRVDVSLQLGPRNYAIEHTLVEAFADQIKMDVRFGELIGPIVAELSGSLPSPGRYELAFPIDTRLGSGQAGMAAAQRALITWVRAKAQLLHDQQPRRLSRSEQPHGHASTYRERPPGVPFEVVLTRRLHWTDLPRLDGFLAPLRFAPKDVEPMRRARLDTALNKKCLKLQQCKDAGATSILVLKDRDRALSNHLAIGEAFAEALAGRLDRPDEVFLIETIIEPWIMRTLLRGDVLWPEEDYIEVDPATLVNLTGD